MDALKLIVTDIGLSALINLTDNGVEGIVSHVAFGDAANNRYEPQQDQTQLVRERARVQVLEGGKLSPFEIRLDAVLDEGPEFNINEVGFFLENGALLAVWADPDKTLLVKSVGVPLAVTFNLALSGIPANSINLNVTGPNLNFDAFTANLRISADFLSTWQRMMASDVAQYRPQILNTWR